MKISSLILGLALIVAGCTATRWTKPGLTEAEFRREAYECERDGRQSGYFGTGLVGALNFQSFVERCMEAKGYRKMGSGEVVQQEEPLLPETSQPPENVKCPGTSVWTGRGCSTPAAHASGGIPPVGSTVAESRSAPASRPVVEPRLSASGLNGTFRGEITGNAANRVLKMPVTLTLVHSGHQLVGTWTTASGASGTLTGVLSENGIQLGGKQVYPCEGDFAGIAVVEATTTLRGSYVGKDCNGPVTASFTVTRE